MKVRCVKLLSHAGKLIEYDSWMTIGKIYHVLAVELSRDGRWHFRLRGDGENGVALFLIDQFEIVSSKIPPTWVIAIKRGKLFQLTPEPWSYLGFMERYYNGDPEAIKIFHEEEKKIIEADP